MKILKVLTICALSLCLSACCNNSNKQAAEVAEESAKTITGVVLDGAMNSIFIITSNNDTLSFGYPEIDKTKVDSYMIGDTVVVNFITVTIDGHPQDSVTSVVNVSNPVKIK